jgi:F-type H+-transporting ATPase subunit a
MPQQLENIQQSTAPKKRGFMGCSMQLIIGIVTGLLVFIVLGLLLRGRFPELLKVEAPNPSIPAETVFHIGGFGVTNTMLGAWLGILIIGIIAAIATGKMKDVPGRLQSLAEFVFVEYPLGICRRIAGEENGRRFFPLVTSIFFFVLMNAWVSLLPIFNGIILHEGHIQVPLLRNANTDINTPLALAIVSFFAVLFWGFRIIGPSYPRQFFDLRPVFNGIRMIFKGNRSGIMQMFQGLIMLVAGLIEGVMQLARLVSFTLRLFGNMTAGELLLMVMTFLIPFAVVDIFAFLESFLGFVQAIIFAALTLIFITVAVTPHSEEHT